MRLGAPRNTARCIWSWAKGLKKTAAELIRELIGLYFERTNADLTPGTFRAVGNAIEIMPTGERVLYRVEFEGEKIEKVRVIDAITRAEKGREEVVIPLSRKTLCNARG